MPYTEPRKPKAATLLALARTPSAEPTSLGGSRSVAAIEASKIAGHRDLKMTNEYTFIAPERQNELTRRIQRQLADVAEPSEGATQPTCEMTDALRKLEELAPVTPNLQSRPT